MTSQLKFISCSRRNARCFCRRHVRSYKKGQRKKRNAILAWGLIKSEGIDIADCFRLIGSLQPIITYQATFDRKVLTVFNFFNSDVSLNLNISPLSTTKVSFADSLDPDETPSNSASRPDPSCLALRQHCNKLWATSKHIEADEKFSRRHFNWRAKG